jgi:hypothetical protein
MSRIVTACVSVVVLAAAAAAGSASTASGLRGTVTVSPTQPVCIEGQPCSKPAPGALIVFRRDGRVAAHVTTRSDASYRVLLAPGVYTVNAPQYHFGAGVTPRAVRVPKGRIAHVDLEIDSGIQ